MAHDNSSENGAGRPDPAGALRPALLPLATGLATGLVAAAVLLAGCGGGRRPGPAAAVGAPPAVPAALAGADMLRVDPVAPGVRHIYAWDARGPWAIGLLEVDAGRCGPVYEARKAGPPLSERATTAELAEGSLAAINADFFRIPGGTTVGAHVRGGEVVAGPGERPVLALAADDGWWIGRPTLRGALAAGRAGRLPVVQVNRPEAGDTAGAVLFTRWIGAAAPADSDATVALIRLVAGADAGAGGTGVVVRVDTAGSPAGLEAGLEAGVIAVRGRARAAEWLRGLAPGDTVHWDVALVPADTARGPADTARGPADTARGPADTARGPVVTARGPVVTARGPADTAREPARVGAVDGGRDGATPAGATLAGPAATGAAAGGGQAAAAREAVGGFPVLLRGGRLAPEMADGVRPEFGERRHPRTAVGVADGGRRVLWIVVDGRQEPYSAGMSLHELALLLRDLGAEEAINLDGGGSSTLVVAGRVANRPSDRTGQRPVGNALVLVACRAGG